MTDLIDRIAFAVFVGFPTVLTVLGLLAHIG
jgi:hypothetical protein